VTKSSVLHTSHATDVLPSTQTCRERGLLAAAALGETHLHVSTLAPRDVLALGAFHRRPKFPSDVEIWPRHTGGRALPSGNGFVLVTLALPHRSALVADERLALAPEQVMNRCVRGVLNALRSLGIDVVYPGLDLLTHERRAIGVLGFIESDGPTLFQAILGATASFADGPFLLDRADPEGMVAANFMAPNDTSTLVEVAGAQIEPTLPPPVFTERLAKGYADAFGVDPQAIDDDVTTVLADAYRAGDPLVAAPDPHGASARVDGRIGPVEAWVRVEDDHLTGFTLAGDFLSPAATPAKLAKALDGCPPSRNAIEERINGFVNPDDGYFLGLRPSDLTDLVQRSAGVT